MGLQKIRFFPGKEIPHGYDELPGQGSGKIGLYTSILAKHTIQISGSRVQPMNGVLRQDPMLQPFMDMMLAKWGAAAGDSGGENDDDEVERPDDDDDEANLAEGNFGVEWDEAGHQVALLDPYPSFISSPVPTPSPAPICDADPNSKTATSSDEKASSPAEAPAKKEHVFECQLVRKPAFTSLLMVASPQNAAQKAGPTVEERLARLSELRMLSVILFYDMCIFVFRGVQD